jgi:hypothetical protein
VRSVAYRLTHVFSEAIKHKSFEMDAEKIRNLLIEAANTIFQLAARECDERNTGQTVECVQQRLMHPVPNA